MRRCTEMRMRWSPSGLKPRSSSVGFGLCRIKEVPHLERVEFKAVAEIFFRSRVLYRHKGPAFRASHSDAVADTAL
jgi:hypothetical protein